MYNEWNEPLKKWDAHRVKDFFTWAREVYGEEPFKDMLESYRAVMDVKNSVVPQYDTNPYTDALAHSMLHTKQVIAANILNQAFKEVYEEHGKALLNEHNQS
jgi:hypothetical protein